MVLLELLGSLASLRDKLNMLKTIKPASGFKYRMPPKKKPRWKIRGLSFFILIIFFLILFTYVLPSATVIVIPETEPVSREFLIELTVDESRVDRDKNTFLAQIATAEEQEEKKFQATGKKDLGEKAQGQAVFYNQTGRSEPLNSAMDLVSDSGLIFVVKEEVTIPAARVDDNGKVVAGQTTAVIEAKEPGEKGNTGVGRLNISTLDLERQSKVYGEIKTALSGGTSKIVKVVSQDDLDNAKADLVKDLAPKVKEKLKKQVGKKMAVDDKLISYDDSEITKEVEVDREAENFTMSLNLKSRALVYDESDLKTFLKEQVLKELSVGETIATDELGQMEMAMEKFDITLGLANFKIKATFPVSKKIDLEDVKKNILGKKESDARRYILSLPHIKDVRFMFSLSLTDKIPDYESKVKVKVGE